MDTLICNKCFAPMYRGKQPYNIMQCGHIFCQNCLQQVEKQCSQCQFVGPLSIPLREPLIPKVAPFFVPFSETLELLLKVDMFRSTQIKILMQRFHQLDKKYELLKNQYWATQRNLKLLTQKYLNIKAEKDKLDKRMLLSQIHCNNFSQCNSNSGAGGVMKMPTKSNIFTPSSTGYSSGSDTLKSVNITPVRSVNSGQQFGKMIDGFLVPNSRRPLRSTGSFSSSCTSSGGRI